MTRKYFSMPQEELTKIVQEVCENTPEGDRVGNPWGVCGIYIGGFIDLNNKSIKLLSLTGSYVPPILLSKIPVTPQADPIFEEISLTNAGRSLKFGKKYPEQLIKNLLG
jgi:hypothetical protein